jgi:multicomponent Na+:H+ antiporter subunit G
VAVHFQELGVTTRAVLVIAFFFLTAPVGAHVIARAAYAVGVPLWEGTITDELRDRRPATTQPAPDGPPASPAPPAAPEGDPR